MESARDATLTLNMTMDIFVYAIFCHCERAQRASAATNRIKHSKTFDYFSYRLAKKNMLE